MLIVFTKRNVGIVASVFFCSFFHKPFCKSNIATANVLHFSFYLSYYEYKNYEKKEKKIIWKQND